MRTASWLCFILAGGLALLYLFQGYYPEFMRFFSNFFPPIISGAAVVASVFALRKYWENLGSRLSRVWLSFMMGMIFWFLGELGWAFYTLVLNVKKPYPSVADAFWLIGYVPLFIALYVYVKTFQPAVSKRMLRIAGGMTFLVSLMIIFALIPPIMAMAEDPLTEVVELAYPTLDVLLFAIALLGLLIFTVSRLKGKMETAWLLINAGIFMNVVGDVLFSYTTLAGTYWNLLAHPLELFFHGGYILFLLAFYTHMKEL